MCTYAFAFFQVINMRGNRFKNIKIDFKHYLKLREVNMGNNRLSNLFSNTTFSIKHRDMKNLLFDNCGISNLPPRMLQTVPSIEYINLSYNRIKRIPTGFFHYLTHLRSVVLAGNHLISLNSVFLRNDALSYLNLLNNKIENLENDFPEACSLKTLRLDGNKFSMLRQNEFKHLSSLQKLSISRNKITDLHKNVFVAAKTLKVLVLNRNHISSLNEAVGGLSSLSILSVNYNKLEMLSEQDMTNLEQLKSLDLRNNILHSVNNAFKNLKNLHFLNLQKNKLTILPRKTFPPAMTLKVLRSAGKDFFFI